MPAIPSLIFHFISLVERNPYITARPADYEYRPKINSPMKYKKTQELTRQNILNLNPIRLARLRQVSGRTKIAKMCGVTERTIQDRFREYGIKYKKK